MQRLDLYSEPYSPNGNISADGLGKALGTPSLDRLRIMFREAIQNSWDARRDGCTPLFRVHLRKLTANQAGWYRENVFWSLPDDGGLDGPLRDWESRGCWVLELSDFGTTGLGGPVRADQVLEGSSTDFVDFVRNVGSPRDKRLGGGTYGYGKSASYLGSRLRTIAISSRTEYRAVEEDRFIVARLGSTFTRPAQSGMSSRFTGRHWWGALDPSGHTVDPLQGATAGWAMAQCGVPREPGEKGTSVTILDPEMDGKTPIQVVNTFIETVLWYFWPKLAGVARKRMHFEAFLDGTRIGIPQPDEYPPLDGLVRSIESIRDGGPAPAGISRVSITYGVEKKHLGWLAMAKSIRLPRVRLDTGDEQETVPPVAHHVALMRNAELVVRYLEGPEPASTLKEYTGVFVAAEEVDDEFARSEPPAHDDWIPDYLQGKAKSWVRVAKRRIGEEMVSLVSPVQDRSDSASDQASLGAMSDRLGGMLAGSPGERVGPEKGTVGSSNRKKRSILGPKHAGFEEHPSGGACAVFEFGLVGTWKPGQRISAACRILIEGGSTKAPLGVDVPAVVEWRDVEGKPVEGQDDGILCLPGDVGRTYQVLVGLPESHGVQLSLSDLSTTES